MTFPIVLNCFGQSAKDLVNHKRKDFSVLRVARKPQERMIYSSRFEKKILSAEFYLIGCVGLKAVTKESAAKCWIPTHTPTVGWESDAEIETDRAQSGKTGKKQKIQAMGDFLSSKTMIR